MSRTKIASPHLPLGLLLTLPIFVACTEGEEVAVNENQIDSFAGLPSDYSYPEELHMGSTNEPFAAPYDDQGAEDLAAPVRDRKYIDILLRSARNVVAMDQAGEAIGTYEDLLARDPEHMEARQEYAGLLIQEGRLVDAAAQFRILIEAQPSDARHRRALAGVLVQTREFDEASEQLRRVLMEDPEDVETAATLARLYTWTKDFHKAEDIYGKHLQSLDPRKESDQILLAPVLLDLHRPQDALDTLERLHRKTPEDLRWSIYLARCYTQLGEHEKASEILDQMSEVRTATIDERLELASYLSLVGSYKNAMKLYDQVLDVAPANKAAKIGSARIQLHAFLPSAARRTLDTLEGDMGSDRQYQLTLGSYHVLIGDYAAAEGIYKDALSRAPEDHEFRTALGDMFRISGEYEKASGELRKIPKHSSRSREARYLLAKSLSEQHQYEDANTICQVLYTEDGRDPRPLLLLVRNLGRLGSATQAEALGRKFLELNRTDAHATVNMEIALGNLMLDEKRYLEAARLFQSATAHPYGQLAEAYYGLAKAQANLDNRIGATRALLSSTLSRTGDDIRSRIILAEIATGDGEWKEALDMYRHVLRWDPENLAAMVRLGEVETLLLRNTEGVRVDPITTFERVIARSPNNLRARIGMARAFSRLKDFDQSLEQYDLALASDADNIVAHREKARLLYWTHQYDESVVAYDALQAPAAVEAFPMDIFGTRSPEASLHTEMEYEALVNVQENIQLEKEAKRLAGFRDQKAVDVYKRLIAREPNNTEARFDLAQIYTRKKHTKKALQEYQDLLNVDPHHEEALDVLKRLELKTEPRVVIGMESFDAKGRGGLSQMAVDSYLVGVEYPFGDENETFSVSYGRKRYTSPTLIPEDPSNPGGNNVAFGNMGSNVFAISAQDKFKDNVLLKGALLFNEFDRSDGFDDRPLFDLGVEFQTKESTRIEARLFTDNVAENGQSVNDDIHRTGTSISMNSKPSRMWDYGGNFTYADYSDRNTLYELNTYASYLSSLPPQQLKFLLKLDYKDFAEQDNFEEADNVHDAFDADHPYFAPSNYMLYSAGVEWKHWLNPELYHGSEDIWYSVNANIMLDNNSENYTHFGVTATYEVSETIHFAAETSALRSSVVDRTGARLFFLIRIP
jgi:tetratricopeptide (TPR) repeat protein